jgi:hypothetical protein
MAFTRKMMAAMGIDEDKIEQLIEAHAEVVDALKQQRDDSKAEAAKVPELEEQIKRLEAEKPKEDMQAKYDDLQKRFDEYKAGVASEKAASEKAALYRDMLRGAGVDEKRLDAIMRVTDLTDVGVTDGKLDNADDLKAKAAEEWAAFIPRKSENPAGVANPPATPEGGDAPNADVVARLKERHERKFGKQETGKQEE